MEWRDHGIVLHHVKHGERALIIHCFTQHNGLCSGIVPFGKKYASMCQAGNLLELHWKARLEEHLGKFTTLEPENSFAPRIMQSREALLAMQSALSLMRQLLPERDPHPALYHQLITLLETLATKPQNCIEAYIHFELLMLKELGFALQLQQCVDTKTSDNLHYVSPRTGCAVCQTSGAPYAHKLLTLPPFLRPCHIANDQVNVKEAYDGLQLTGYFLNNVAMQMTHKPIAGAREQFVNLWKRKTAS